MVVFKTKILILDSCNTFLKIDKEIWNTDTSPPHKPNPLLFMEFISTNVYSN